MRRTIEYITFAEPIIFLCHDIIVLEDLKNINQKQPIEIIGNSATVINLVSHEFHGIPRDSFILGQEVLDHTNRCAKISIAKFISDVPAQGSKLSAFLYHCVEDCILSVAG